MNKIYKVIWSRTKNAYVVASEFAKGHSKSSSSAKAVAAAVLALSLAGAVPALAADTTVGAGNGVAYGTGSNAPKAENVAVGKNAKIQYSNGASNATGDIVVGSDANINNYASQGGSIAIGKNAKIENMAGGLEAGFAFGQTTYSGSLFSPARIPADPTKVIGSVAIGDNTFARTGSTMVGSHNYQGALGDVSVDSASTRTSNLHVYTTNIGANSFINGAFATSTGVYNIMSSEYNGGRLSNPYKNFGATISGSLNSIESQTGGYYSGVASAITGLANRVANANGALVYGAGNEITNSIATVSAVTSSGDSAKDFQTTLMNGIKAANGGGATMAFGGGNVADYTMRSSLIGVNNTLKGASGNTSDENVLYGYKNTGTNVDNVSVIGSNNNVGGSSLNTEDVKLIGDNRTVDAGASHTVILGSADKGTPLTTDVSKAVVLGYKANVTKEGGVALGAESVANTDAEAVGYDPSTAAPSTETTSVWKSTRAAVSVGDAGNGITRQITGVAAGTADTDAVNVAQLKALAANIGASGGADTKVTDGSISYNNSGAGILTLTNTGEDAAGETVTDTVEIGGFKNYYTTGVEFSDNKLIFTRNDGGTYEAEGIVSTDDTSWTSQIDGTKVKDVKIGGVQNFVSGDNIQLSSESGAIKIATKQDVSFNSINTNSIKAGNVTINENGIDAGEQKITNVADGTNPSDAVNYGQLAGLGGKIDRLERRTQKGIAGAAALAALHPMDFNPDSKLQFSAGYGNYHSEHAAAVGAFYRPDESVMFSVGGSVGNGENLVNVGVTFALDGNKNRVTRSRTAMASEIVELRSLVTQMAARLDRLDSADNGQSVMFPDVPENHWAYQYVENLQKLGILEGYPDGLFKGERSMTRYEFAAMLDRAVQSGIKLDTAIAKEFKPELGRIYVERISGADDSRNKIERVRVRNQDEKTRDVYGNKISTVD